MGLGICKGIQCFELFIILFSCFCLNLIISIDTITNTQSITDHEIIISSNEAFQLGFFSPVNTTNRYVGIWYNIIPVRAVVWVANRDRPLTDSSGTLVISEDGKLVVLSGQKEIVWSSNVSNSVGNSSARLLDSGNLVLVDDSSGRTIWESFRNPSDSFIERMNLSSNPIIDEKMLMKSWRSPSDPSIGSFRAGVNPLTIPEIYVWNGSRPYWRSGPWNGLIFIGVESMTATYGSRFMAEDNKQGNVSFTFTTESLILYFVLSHEGNLLQKTWTEGMQEAEVTWVSRATECDVYGTCGPFGSCNPKDSPICSCLRGFEPKWEREWNSGNFNGGCVRKKPLQCERNESSSQESKKDGFLKLTTMKVPELAEVIASITQDECESQCLENCTCTAYSFYMGIGCMRWSGHLIDIQKYSSTGADLYIRVAHSELDKRKNMKVVIAISVIIVTIVIAICAYFSWIWMAKERGVNMKLNQVKIEELPLFTFEKLKIATDKFNLANKLGQGGFGAVYKGKLPDGPEIAVKRLSRSSEQGLEEFLNEVIVISKLQHRNLVRLLGCCVEEEEKILIYEYMPNKSLDAFLFDPHQQEFLEWSKRLNIIYGVGRGLLYLHRDSRLRIIHRDLKASNILLDEELNPKISDFGIARIFGGDEDQAKTRRVVGTYGYMAPEYAMEGRFSEKSDVFSFGVLLIEIVSGRRNNSFYDDELSLSLLGFAWKLWNEDNIVTLIDPRISFPDFQLEILRCIQIGLLCVQEFAIDRPSMSTVLSMLTTEIAHLAKPKQPAFTQRRTLSEPLQHFHSGCTVNDCTVTIVEGR